jgi:hypothetical protein
MEQCVGPCHGDLIHLRVEKMHIVAMETALGWGAKLHRDVSKADPRAEIDFQT